MNLFKWRRVSKGRQFVPIGGTKKKQYLRPRHRRNHNHHTWSCLIWPIARLFSGKSRSKTKRSSDDTTSPDKTALMSFEELSSCDDDSYTSNSIPSFTFLDQFPIWKETTVNLEVDEHEKLPDDNHRRSAKHTFPDVIPRTKCSSNWSKQATELQPFARLLAPQTSSGNGLCRSDESTNQGEVDSQHFSISTDFHNSVSYRQPQEVTSSKTFDSCFTPTSSTSWDMEECEYLSRVTLQKFMDSNVNDLPTTSVMISAPPMNRKNLSDVTTNDNISVGSTLLAVSYDEQYPQLVLQPSLDDGTAGSIRENAGKTSLQTNLGVNFAHPAARTPDLYKCPPTVDQNITFFATGWLKESLQKEWKQIDFDLANEGSFYEASTTSAPASFADPPSLNWFIEGALEWSHSASEGVKNFTDMIGKEVVQPIISLVDTAPPKKAVPSKKTGTSRLRLVPQDRKQKLKKQNLQHSVCEK